MFDQKLVRQNTQRVVRLMDYISKNHLTSKGKNSAVFNDIYQMLGVAWNYYGLMCCHGKGHRLTKENREACRVCGKIKDTPEYEMLLPVRGPKSVGRYIGSPKVASKSFDSRRKATLVEDSITFHGVKVKVHVHHSFPSDILGKNVSIAAGRELELNEKGIRVFADDYLVGLEFPNGKGGHKEKYGSFAHELPKKLLAKFPIIYSYGPKGQFYGIKVFRPRGERPGG